jgi:signal transduction histidine kinase
MDVFKVIKRYPVAFPLACAATAAIVLVSQGSYRRSVGTLDELGTSGAAQMSIHALQRNILDAEAGQRGYLLTSRKEYLQPYAIALERINEAFQVLDDYYSKVPQSGEALRTLHALTETRLSELAVTIRLHEEGRGSAATELVRSDIGKEQMDAIRTVSAELLEREMRHLAATRQDLLLTLSVNRIGVVILSIISLLTLYLVLRQPSALERRQQVQRRLVQAERDRLEIEVKHRTTQLTELAHHLQTAREDERQRLARDLHDELGAILTSAKLDAARIKSRLVGSSPEALELLAHLVETLNGGIALGRRIIESLRPSALSNLGLVATLEILAREFSEHSGVEVHAALEPVTLEASAELMIYRLVQEAITNITKYAKASHVWLSLGKRDGQVEVSVRDNGVGFDTTASPRSAYGLLGMRFRVEAEGGNLTLISAPSQGTTITARLPESKSVSSI